MWMVVVTSLGSSAEPIGGGSTYFSVVMSGSKQISRDSCKDAAEHGRHTLFLVDFLLYEEIDAEDYQVGNDVQRADTHEDLGVFKWYLLGDLHHSEDDHQVGATLPSVLALWLCGFSSFDCSLAG